MTPVSRSHARPPMDVHRHIEPQSRLLPPPRPRPPPPPPLLLLLPPSFGESESSIHVFTQSMCFVSFCPQPNLGLFVDQFPAVPAEAAVAAVLGAGSLARAGDGVASAGGWSVQGEGSVGGRATAGKGYTAEELAQASKRPCATLCIRPTNHRNRDDQHACYHCSHNEALNSEYRK